MTKPLELLQKAIENTKNNSDEEVRDYYEKMMKQRLKGNEVSAGSYYQGVETIEELENMLLHGEYEIVKGSVEDGLLIMKSNSFKGFEGIIPIEDVNKEDIILLNPKNIPDRVEQYIMVDSIDNFLPTSEAYFIIGTKNQDNGQIGLEHIFFITHYPGKIIEADDTIVGGPFVKMIVKS